MVRPLCAVILCALVSGCTLLVEGAIAKPDGGVGPDGGPCVDTPFDDGFTDGGVRFKGNVTALWSHGPSGPPALHPRPEYYGAGLAFVQSGQLYLGGGNDRGAGLYGAVALAAGGLGFGLTALSAAHNADAGTARRRAHLADIFYVGALAGAGAALYLWRTDTSSARVAPTAGGASASVELRW